MSGTKKSVDERFKNTWGQERKFVPGRKKRKRKKDEKTDSRGTGTGQGTLKPENKMTRTALRRSRRQRKIGFQLVE